MLSIIFVINEMYIKTVKNNLVLKMEAVGLGFSFRKCERWVGSYVYYVTRSDKGVTTCPFGHPELLIPAESAIKEL